MVSSRDEKSAIRRDGIGLVRLDRIIDHVDDEVGHVRDAHHVGDVGFVGDLLDDICDHLAVPPDTQRCRDHLERAGDDPHVLCHRLVERNQLVTVLFELTSISWISSFRATTDAASSLSCRISASTAVRSMDRPRCAIASVSFFQIFEFRVKFFCHDPAPTRTAR